MELVDTGDPRGDVIDARVSVASTSGLRNDSEKGRCGSGVASTAHLVADGLRRADTMLSTGSNDDDELISETSSSMLVESRRDFFLMELL